MKYTYEIVPADFGAEVIKRTDENDVVTWIPKDPLNSDYQQYLNRDEKPATKSK